MSMFDAGFWTIVLILATAFLYLLYWLVPSVRISDFQRSSSPVHGTWYGVTVTRRGFPHACRAYLTCRSTPTDWDKTYGNLISGKLLGMPSQSNESVPLMASNQWDAKPQEPLESFDLFPSIPCFVPLLTVVPFPDGLKVRPSSPDQKCIALMHQNERKWSYLHWPDLYEIELSVYHGTLWPSRRRIYFKFDGYRVNAVSADDVKRWKQNEETDDEGSEGTGEDGGVHPPTGIGDEASERTEGPNPRRDQEDGA